MGRFTFTRTDIEGLCVIEPHVFGDHRGFFFESWNTADFEANGLNVKFVQDNHSMSAKGVLRGLHFQRQKPQGKLVRVVAGEVFDVAVDWRIKSPTFGKWHGIILSAENKRQFYVPEGFAHGFLVLSDTAEFLYKTTQFYDPADEGGVLWNDPEIGIEWPDPGCEIRLSEKDTKNPLRKDMKFFFE